MIRELVTVKYLVFKGLIKPAPRHVLLLRKSDLLKFR